MGYYQARYYDPVVGRFLSADDEQGNFQGMDPYAYVNGNPETLTDPSGHRIVGENGSYAIVNPNGGGVVYEGSENGSGTYYPINDWQVDEEGASSTPFWIPDTGQFGGGGGGGNGGGGNGGGGGHSHGASQPKPPDDPIVKRAKELAKGGAGAVWWAVDNFFGITDIKNDFGTLFNGNASAQDKFGAVVNLIVNGGMDISMLFGVGEGLRAGEFLGKEGLDALMHLAEECGAGLSFTADTQVSTDHGPQAIGELKKGEKVVAYNQNTHTTEYEPIVHIWLNHDNDLVDMTVTSQKGDDQGKIVTKKSEVLHTTKKHPFLTVEQGFLAVEQIQEGMHLREADGSIGVVSRWKVVAGAKDMYNLEVEKDHTFTVGQGQYIVHNCAKKVIRDFVVGESGTVYQDSSRMTVSDSLDAMEDVVGKGYTQKKPGVFMSSDKTRIVHMTDSDLERVGNHAGAPHINLVEKEPNSISGKLEDAANVHIFLTDFP